MCSYVITVIEREFPSTSLTVLPLILHTVPFQGFDFLENSNNRTSFYFPPTCIFYWGIELQLSSVECRDLIIFLRTDNFNFPNYRLPYNARLWIILSCVYLDDTHVQGYRLKYHSVHCCFSTECANSVSKNTFKNVINYMVYTLEKFR